jgi:hypothetical protein
MVNKCFRSLIYQSTEPAVIILEDLSVAGFEKLNSLPDDYETTKMIFHRLAMFHAASFYLLQDVRKSILYFNRKSHFFSFVKRKLLTTRASTTLFTICQTPFKSHSSGTT